MRQICYRDLSELLNIDRTLQGKETFIQQNIIDNGFDFDFDLITIELLHLVTGW